MNRKIESETELGPEKTNIGTVSSINGRNEKEPFNLKKWLKIFGTSITVEPYVVLYYCAIIFTLTGNQYFYFEKACRADLNYTKDLCLKAIAGESDNATVVEAITDASIVVAELNAWKNPAQFAIPAIYGLFLGAWLDKSGNRNAVLILPMVGEFLTLVGAMLSMYFMSEWKLWVMGFVEVLFAVFTGGFTIAMTGSYYYIAAVTSEESRTFRIGIFVCIVRSVIVISSMAPVIKFLSDGINYVALYGISMACHAVGVIYVFLRIPNVRKDGTEGTFWYKLRLFFNPQNVLDTFALLYKSRGTRLVQIILILLSQLAMLGPSSGEGHIMYLYMRNAFKINISDYSWHQAWSNVISTVGVAIAVTIFSKWLKCHDTVLGLICTVSNFSCSVTSGLASNLSWFFVGAVMDIFGGAAGTPIMSLGTKFVSQNDIGKVLTLIRLNDSLIPEIFSSIYSKVLSKTFVNGLYNGTVYLFGAALTATSFVTLGVLYYLYKKEQRDLVQNPEIKEVHAYDNEDVSPM